MKTKRFFLMIIGLIFVSFYMSCGSRNNAGLANMEQQKRADYSAPAVEKEEGVTADDQQPVPDNKTDTAFNTEEYDLIKENEFKDARENPLSTFSIDVDNASYSNVRRYLNENQQPPKDAIRLEEMINYFKYDYPQPTGEHPFTITTEVAQCPWNSESMIVLIGLQGKSLNYNDLKPCNLVFLIDCSGSMEDENKLPLLKKSLAMLLDQLSEKDKVAIVAYAGAAGVIIPSTPATKKEKILDAIDDLEAGGSTAGGEGIALAYKIAKENLIPDGNNRVILCTDGDFNVGVSSTSELVRLMDERRKDNIFLTICGFGMGNYKDGRMEQISKAGAGNYFYIDSKKEAEKVFVKEMRANMFTIAKDVKIQVEFNPSVVKGYRLIGYENRIMANEDFNDDLKDAGELGAGHTVTAMYEILPVGSKQEVKKSGNLKYQETKIKGGATDELMTVKFRYKPIKSETSILLEQVVKTDKKSYEAASENMRFALSVAGFGMVMRDSKFKGDLTYDKVLNMAKSAMTRDQEGYRAEFIQLVEKAKTLKP